MSQKRVLIFGSSGALAQQRVKVLGQKLSEKNFEVSLASQPSELKNNEDFGSWHAAIFVQDKKPFNTFSLWKKYFSELSNSVQMSAWGEGDLQAFIQEEWVSMKTYQIDDSAEFIASEFESSKTGIDEKHFLEGESLSKDLSKAVFSQEKSGVNTNAFLETELLNAEEKSFLENSKNPSFDSEEINISGEESLSSDPEVSFPEVESFSEGDAAIEDPMKTQVDEVSLNELESAEKVAFETVVEENAQESIDTIETVLDSEENELEIPKQNTENSVNVSEVLNSEELLGVCQKTESDDPIRDSNIFTSQNKESGLPQPKSLDIDSVDEILQPESSESLGKVEKSAEIDLSAFSQKEEEVPSDHVIDLSLDDHEEVKKTIQSSENSELEFFVSEEENIDKGLENVSEEVSLGTEFEEFSQEDNESSEKIHLEEEEKEPPKEYKDMAELSHAGDFGETKQSPSKLPEVSLEKSVEDTPLAIEKNLEAESSDKGAYSRDDYETLKRYAALKEREAREKNATNEAIKNQLQKLREQLALSDDERRRLQLSNEELKAQLRVAVDKRDENKHHWNALETEYEQKQKDLQVRLDSSEFKSAKAERKLEEFREKVRNDIQKIRSRERELTNRLELQKRDAEALLGAKDEKLLQQKREIDRFEFELETLKERLIDEGTKNEERSERLIRAIQSLKLAQGVLSSLEDEGVQTDSPKSSGHEGEAA